MLRSYAILCTRKDCARPAVYKIAARWSDGTTEELKTYALCCAECLPEAYRLSCEKQKACRTTTGEKLEAPSMPRMEQIERSETSPPAPMPLPVSAVTRGSLEHCGRRSRAENAKRGTSRRASFETPASQAPQDEVLS